MKKKNVRLMGISDLKNSSNLNSKTECMFIKLIILFNTNNGQNFDNIETTKFKLHKKKTYKVLKSSPDFVKSPPKKTNKNYSYTSTPHGLFNFTLPNVNAF